MMDLQTIRELSEKAGKEAMRERKQPAVFTEEEIARARGGDISQVRNIPNLGTYQPKGWRRIDFDEEEFGPHSAYFVDSSGFGQPGEPALTVHEFIAKLKPGYGYAIVEAGQFQVYIGLFKKRVVTWDIEYTDTFGGEPNYSWVKRQTLELPEGLSDLAVMRKAKAAMGLNGVKGRSLRYSDIMEFRPRNSCTVMFATARY